MLQALSAANNDLASLHRDLARRTADLEEMIRRKDEILAMVTHDLRNPLGSIAGFADLLARQLDDQIDARARTMLGRITRLSAHMLSLVDDLLDVTVIERGQLTLDRAETDVAALVAETVDAYRLSASDKDVTIELHVPDDPVVADVDRVRVLQVIDNLLSNAVKFSPNRAAASVAVTCSVEDDHVRLTVADEGIGIPESEQEQLFEPFGSVRMLGTAEERSTGLGLAISRSIVRAHGGRIGIDSAPGHGSVFEVLLPVEAPGSGWADG